MPVDFSEHAANAISHAREIAATYDAGLDLLHVIEDPPRPGFYDAASWGLEGIADDAEEEAVSQMHRLFISATGPAVDVWFHAVIGDAREAIVRFADESGAALIVITTRGLSGVGHFLMGSVAEKVVRRAQCPVLSLKNAGNRGSSSSVISHQPGMPARPARCRPYRH